MAIAISVCRRFKDLKEIKTWMKVKVEASAHRNHQTPVFMFYPVLQKY